MSNQNLYPDNPGIPDPASPDGEEITPGLLCRGHGLGSHPAREEREEKRGVGKAAEAPAMRLVLSSKQTNRQMQTQSSSEVMKLARRTPIITLWIQFGPASAPLAVPPSALSDYPAVEKPAICVVHHPV